MFKRILQFNLRPGTGSKKSILFVADHRFSGTAAMRAQAVAEYLRRGGYCANVINARNDRPMSPRKIAKCAAYDVIVFVKYPHYHCAQLLLKLGRSVWVDPIDNFGLFGSSPKYIAKKLGWIATSSIHACEIKKWLNNPETTAMVIHHHHSNYENAWAPKKTTKTVGYIGRMATFSLPESVVALMDSLGISLRAIEAGAMSSEEIINFILELDGFIIYFSDSHYKKFRELPGMTVSSVLLLKPSQKLTLPFSLGIPTVFRPYVSYIDAITKVGQSPKDFLIANTDDELAGCIEWLADDRNAEKRESLIFRQKIVADAHHIEKVIPSYEEMIMRSP